MALEFISMMLKHKEKLQNIKYIIKLIRDRGIEIKKMGKEN